VGEFHSLLRRQLRRVFGHADAPPPELRPLVDAVDAAYREFDADRALLERSLDLSSQELLRANADMVALFQAVPDRFYRLDGAERVIDHRGGRTGEGEPRVVGQRFRELLPAPAVSDFETALAGVRQQRTIQSFEYVVGGDGGETAWEARVVPLADDEVVVILRDISDRRRAQAATATLTQIGQELAATLDLDRVAQQIVTAVVVLLQARSAALYRMDAGDALVCIASGGGSDPRQWVGRVLTPGEGVGGQAAVRRRVVWSADFLNDPAIPVPAWLKDRAEHEAFRSVMAVPLLSRERVIGVLAMGDVAGRAYTEDERRLLGGLGDQAAIAIENARLFDESERRRRAAEALAELGRLVSASLEPADVADRMLQALHGLLPCRMVALYRVEPETADLVLLGGIGPRVDWNRRLARGTGTIGRAVLERRPVATSDLLADAAISLEPEARARVERSDFRAVLAVPLVTPEGVLGGLTVGDAAGRVFDAEEIRLVQALADQAALALANAELYAQTRTRLDGMRRLAELSHVVSSSLDLQHVLDAVAEAALAVLRGDLARVWVADRDTGRLRAAALRAADGAVPSGLLESDLPPGDGIVGWVMRQKARRYSPDLAEDPLILSHDRVRRLGYVSQLAVPLVAGEEAVGALVVLTRAVRTFSEEDVDMLDVFAAKAATALTNARLYREAREAYEQLSKAQEMLAHSQKMEAVGRLAGGIAHDFNNILTIVMGRCEALLEPLAPDDPRRPDLDLIASATERAATLTRQLLTFSRRQAHDRQVVDLNVVVGGMVKMLRRLIGEDIELVTTLPPDPVYVRADVGQMEQVLLNLAVNARDAMPQGGRLTVATARVTLEEAREAADGRVDAGAWAVLSVADTGQGMDAETRRRLFEPFFTTKESGQGTGLGLSTVYGIVGQHLGHIDVDSAPARGARFSVYLPRVEPDATARPREPLGTPGPRGIETVLVVEDEAQVRAFVRHTLEFHGYTVLDAAEGTEAVRMASEFAGRIDVLLTDLVMPFMSGRAVADAVRRLRPDVRMLYISGYTDEVSGQASEAPDPDSAFIEKPFTGRALTTAVRALLDRPR
jgi:GAF domain-containing protein